MLKKGSALSISNTVICIVSFLKGEVGAVLSFNTHLRIQLEFNGLCMYNIQTRLSFNLWLFFRSALSY